MELTRILQGHIQAMKLTQQCAIHAQPRGVVGRIKEMLEPSVPSTTIVNDGSIFVMMGVWCDIGHSHSLRQAYSRSIPWTRLTMLRPVSGLQAAGLH